MRNFKNIIINSSILFVCASVLQMTLHELGHFIASILIHAKNVALYHNYVSGQMVGVPLSGTIFNAAAGPLVSLFVGVCFHFVCSRQRERNVLFLFNLYMAVFGYIAFFGYLMVAPFFTYGDTGFIFKTLNFPFWCTVSIAIAGGIALFFIMGRLVRFFVEMGTVEIIADKQLRRTFMRSLICYPLYIGIIITALLNLPAPSALSLIYPIFSPFCIMWPYGKAISKTYPTSNMNPDISSIDKIRPVWVIIFFLIVAMNRVLVYGISVN